MDTESKPPVSCMVSHLVLYSQEDLIILLDAHTRADYQLAFNMCLSCYIFCGYCGACYRTSAKTPQLHYVYLGQVGTAGSSEPSLPLGSGLVYMHTCTTKKKE